MARGTTLRRWAPALAWGIWLVGALILAAVLLLGAAPGSTALGELNLFVVVLLGMVVVYPTVGAAIAARRPDHYAGWMLLVAGVAFAFVVLCIAIASMGQPPSGTILPFAEEAAWIAAWAFEPVIAAFAIFFLLLFPDGRLPDRRWRPVAIFAAASLLAYAVGTALDPASVVTDYPWLSNPFAVSSEWANAMRLLWLLGNAGITLALVLAGASLVVRYRRAGTTERLQIKWVAYVGVGMAVVFPIAALQIDGISDVAFLIGFTLVAALPLAVAFAVLRYRLLEIDRLISRTFVYGALTAILAGLYAASLRLFNGLFVAFTGNESDAALVLTTLVLATTLTPMKLRLEGFASQHLAGERDAPDSSSAATPPADAAAPAPRPLSLDDPADVAALEALVERVVRSQPRGP